MDESQWAVLRSIDFSQPLTPEQAQAFMEVVEFAYAFYPEGSLERNAWERLRTSLNHLKGIVSLQLPPGAPPRKFEDSDALRQINEDLKIVLALFQEAGYPNDPPGAKKGR